MFISSVQLLSAISRTIDEWYYNGTDPIVYTDLMMFSRNPFYAKITLKKQVIWGGNAPNECVFIVM